MAAWLTYLKSRILLPKVVDNDQPTTEELEEAVKFQLQRLEAIRNASKKLFNQPQIGLNTFYRGFNDGTKFKYKIIYTSKLFDLLKAYSIHLNKNEIDEKKITEKILF